jgi:uncharacterized protein YgbK (DUF1537 family)
MSGPRLTWLADDFTGATDALDALARAGLRSALFIEPPTPAQLQPLGELDAIGVAGRTRTLGPEAMRQEVGVALAALGALGAPLCHYKVCSTFDSSPRTGSIGAAIEAGLEVLGGEWVPLLVGVPALGRFCVFGNLFARVGSDGAVVRLDRHPVADHPVTPMGEADLLRHLAAQTDLPSGLVASHLAGGEPASEQLRELRGTGARICLFDVADATDLAVAGETIAAAGETGEVRLVVGSSGVEYALAEHWRRDGEPGSAPPLAVAPVDRLVVLSGSCSAVTARQVRWAAAHGFEELALDTAALFGPAASNHLTAVGERLDAALAAGRSVLVDSAVGPDDPRIEAARRAAAGRDLDLVIGTALAELAERAAAAGVARLAFTGGDTSSAAARALGVESVAVSVSAVPGAPLCDVRAPGRNLGGREVLFKGGGLGEDALFGRLRDGGVA